MFRYGSLPYHGRLKLPYNYEPTPEQHELIIASCLGDGSLLQGGNATKGASHHLAWNMGDKHHAEFKQKALSFLGCSLKEGVNPGWGARWYSLVTQQHPFLNKYRPMMYAEDRSPIAAPEVLSVLGPLGWAWWYGDDGHMSDNVAFMHTEGYSDECNENIRQALCRFIDIQDAVSVAKYLGGTPKKLRTMLRFKNEASRKFFEIVAPHMAPSMAYKVGNFYRSDTY